VIAVASEQTLYDRGADVPATPASTTKLLTAATVLASRGPGYRLSTTAVAGSTPGEVVLVGGGDPTLSVDAKGLYPGAARLDQLAAQVKQALGGTRPTRVLVDTSLFSGPQTGLGWSPGDVSPDGQVANVQSLMTNGGRVKPEHNEHGGDPRFADPGISAGQAFAIQPVVYEDVLRGRLDMEEGTAHLGGLNMSEEKMQRKQTIAALLHQTAEDHHIAFKETDGVDPDWSIWAGNHLGCWN